MAKQSGYLQRLAISQNLRDERTRDLMRTFILDVVTITLGEIGFSPADLEYFRDEYMKMEDDFMDEVSMISTATKTRKSGLPKTILIAHSGSMYQRTCLFLMMSGMPIVRKGLDMDELKLKPCPFCGSKEAPALITIDGKDGFRNRYYVVCYYWEWGCGASGGIYHSKEEAVEVWNMRATDNG